jgi:hypothetical protein
MRRSLIAVVAGLCVAGTSIEASPKHYRHAAHPTIYLDPPIATPYAGPPVEDVRMACDEARGCRWKEAALEPIPNAAADAFHDIPLTRTATERAADDGGTVLARTAPADIPRTIVDSVKRFGDFAILKTRTGTARVVGWAGERFQALARDLEAAGYQIHPGCLSSGHMRFSKHHWGGACDFFGQYARDKTRYRQPPPATQIAMAQRRGLISGCMWHDRDCGHFEVPTQSQSVALYMSLRGYSGHPQQARRSRRVASR